MSATLWSYAGLFGLNAKTQASRMEGVRGQPRRYQDEMGLSGQDQRPHFIGAWVRRPDRRVLDAGLVNKVTVRTLKLVAHAKHAEGSIGGATISEAYPK
jgi:hypothetical protein